MLFALILAAIVIVSLKRNGKRPTPWVKARKIPLALRSRFGSVFV
jgi:hypothetical protein